jgi:hypothetical protein
MAAAAKAAVVALAVNYGVHVGSALAYGKLCVPETLWNIAQSLVSTASPVCSALLQTMTLTQNNYAVVLTTAIATTLAGTLKP